MFRRKRKEELPAYAIALQKEIDEIISIVEDQQKQIDALNEQFKTLHELCLKGMES